MGILSLSHFGLRLSAPLTGRTPSTALRDRGTQDLFTSKLEGRLDNYNRGRVAPDDNAVDLEIGNRSAQIADTLATTDPTALKNFSSLLSGLTYSKSARVVTNVEYTVRKLSQIPSEEEAQAQTDKILEAFGRKPTGSVE